MSPTAVSSGAAALEELRRAAAEAQPYRLVVLDYMMPEMDGLDLARKIHGKPELGEPVMLMLSSAAGLIDSRDWKTVGIHRYLTKPVVGSELFDAVVAALVGATAPADVELPGSIEPTGPAGLQILLAEDGVINQRVARALLEQLGHRVDVVANGKRSRRRAQPKTLRPGADGRADAGDGWLRGDRRHPAAHEESGQHVPIVAMTAAP